MAARRGRGGRGLSTRGSNSTGGFGHQPALDGVRGLAVVMVLVFHAGFGWMTAGYVGVSVFFTLSGYLITSLALVEHDGRGKLDVGAFYGRRLRRLLPASLLCLAAVLVMAAAGWFLDDEHVRRDVWGALLQVANWVDLGSGQSYADVVAGGRTAGAPLDHYWSLAIEEQFYWLWPLALLGMLRLGSRGRIVTIASLFAVTAACAPLIAWGWGAEAAYWATPARLAEIVAGAVVAVVLHRRRVPSGPAMVLVAPAALAVIVWAAVSWPSDGGPAYSGWLPALALASAALLVGLQVDSPLRRVLAQRPIVALGVISYGVYLFHWPIYLVIDERTGLGQVPLFAVRVAVTLTVAVLSYVFLERPVRRATIDTRATVRLAVAGAAVIAVAVAIVPLGERLASSSTDGVARADTGVALAVLEPASTLPRRSTASSTTEVAATTTAAPTTTATPTTMIDRSGVPPLPAALSRPVSVIVMGDSTALAAGDGMVAWARDHPELAAVTVVGKPACGFIRSARLATSDFDNTIEGCDGMHQRDLWEQLALVQPDVAVNISTVPDLLDHVWSEEEGALQLIDARFEERLVEDYLTMSQRLFDAGVGKVVWVAPPRPDLPYDEPMATQLHEDRFARFRELLRQHLDGALEGRVVVVDLATWLAGQPEPPERDDGLHWSKRGARDLAERYLAPVVLAEALAP